MRVKGRRQSENIVDIREPMEAAKWELRRRAGNPMETAVEPLVNDYLAREVQDTFRGDQQAAEMLLGPRWKD